MLEESTETAMSQADVFTQPTHQSDQQAVKETSQPDTNQQQNMQTPDDQAKDPSQQAATGDEQALTPSYQPSYKVKSFGKELELDEMLRPLVKDEASEKKVKDIYEKALATEEYRNRFTETQKTIQEKYEPVVRSVQELAQIYQSGDMDGFFEKLQIPEKKIFEWVAEKIRMQELPEEQKAMYNRERLARTQVANLETANARLAEQQAAYQVSQRSFELDQSLARADVKDAAQQWDSLYGENAFKQEVIKTGQFEFFQNRVDLPVAEVLKRTLERMKPVLTRLGSVPQATQSQVRAQPAVIPNPQGRSGSPAKKAIRTMEDLKALEKSMP